MTTEATTPRNRTHLLLILALWFIFYCSFTLVTPPLLDDADSVHAEVAREMLLRHDPVTLYANGIRYLEKAPFLYWSMAASMKLFGTHPAAARFPIALTVLALAFFAEAFARRAFHSARAGFYAAIILLSSFGIFIFSRILLPDIDICLWLTLAMLCFWKTDQQEKPSAPTCYFIAIFCALNILSKGLIGIVFPVGIALLYLLFTRGARGTIQRLKQYPIITSTLIFLALAAPWHILAGLHNPTQGHIAGVTFVNHHWQVPSPTDGNVHGWFWFYFVNEHLLRYLNLRVPRDYDTVPLALFWGLCLIWLMPWSAFIFKSLGRVPWRRAFTRKPLDAQQRTLLLLGIWAALPLLFFTLSTRQEYYVLPSLPALAILVAFWLDNEATNAETFATPNPTAAAGQRIAVVLLALGSIAALACGYFLLHSQAPAPNTDLASLLKQNPGDYALSFGHFLDLNAQAMGAFRLPLVITANALFTGTLANWLLRTRFRPAAANIALITMTFAFLLAAHIGLQTFAPVLSSSQLADRICPVLKPADIIVIHGEYESASTLGFYLQRNDLHILEGRSSNLWYGSFFPDAPRIFEDNVSIQLLWTGPHRIFLWQDLSQPTPTLPGKQFLITQSGGKEIISNKPNDF